MTKHKTGWFSSIDEDQSHSLYQWQPCLETPSGLFECLETWFQTEEQCDQYIRTEILGQGLHEDYY